MFKKVLIANRGEIAVRIMATCREMGIRTVAVYSEADRSARHVREANEAYLIGPAPAAQSYLRIDTILAVARRSGAEAIHPGYGFLSENAAFVEACEEAGIVFIGPPAAAMRLMGSKIAAKALAHTVGAPTVPGYNGESQDDEILQREAQRIGFPLLIKASAGGGGKGMREVHAADDFLPQLAGARREAKAAFGDEMVFLERLLQQPRHIEIQILGDRYGNIIHLGERECSIQRRHQKVLEESPSVALTPDLRAEMGAVAVRIAAAAGYVNAGTLEFMLDDDRSFYFLEMNTRLQVEHPVTELVTGLDLVRQQLRIAAGEHLDITQERINQRGHAIEVRLYAEDAEQNFLPSPGTVAHFVQAEGPGVRVDSGIASGDEITQFYDPMIAKLIVYGEDRPAAIARLQRALASSVVLGVTTNIPLLLAISNQPAFQAGITHTGFLEEQHLLNPPATHVELPDEVLIAAACAEIRAELQNAALSNNGSAYPSPRNPWQTLGPWRIAGGARTLTYSFHDQDYKISLRLLASEANQQNAWSVQIDEQPAEKVVCMYGNDALILLKRGEAQTRTYVQRQQGKVVVALHGQTYHLQRRQPPDVETAAYGSNAQHMQKTLTAPMAGTVVKVQVRDGETVAAHQVLVILSAMKMEHTITAPYEGKVDHVYYQEGAVVPGGAVLVAME
ncbi:MAG TPA: acetyl/propionyl/methylcrotonyl-CoA carboxylase subunit alpha [Ktedonobacteraceae bacterium]|nr:acetyl/propionyl/methylcrotonyl-CoA carboxylase subunit alpha [Ktedonobacteraceae bacterium]